jgi:menaquinone-9 beta-reductase
VIVVGGGPAGAATAACLARKGLDVVVFDRHQFPRDKVCGDFVGPGALVELKALGITDDPAYKRTNKIRDAALFLDGRQLIVQSLPEVDGLPTYGRTIPRLQLDEWVLDAARRAGAEVLEQTRVTGFDPDHDCVTVHAENDGRSTTRRAKVVVGADGSSSTVAKLLRGHAPPKDDRIMAVRMYVSGINGPSDQADLYFNGDSFPGYYWLFPTGRGEANLGLGMLLSTIPPSTEGLRDLLERLVQRDAALAERLGGHEMSGRIVGWPLTTYNPHVALVDDRVVLVGDAAGLINPLNGEGIQYALQSGRWAADTIFAGLEAGDVSASALRPYQAQVSRELRYDMALAGTVVQLIRNRSLNPVWLEALRIIVARAKHDPAYARVVGGILAGLVPASSAISVEVVRSTVEQVAMSLVGRVVWNGVRGPRHLVDAGANAARIGATMLRETSGDPVGLAEWGFGLARQLSELGSQAAQAIIS